MTKASLFEQIGGNVALDAAVDLFYQKVLNDPRINHWFNGVDMAAQRRKQKAFLAYALGAPVKYSGKDLRSAHAHLATDGLNDDHFNVVAENLVETLSDLGVAADLIDEVVALVETTRDDVLSR